MQAANARVLFKHLFERAVSVLPPMLGEADVECYYTVTDLAQELPWTKSQIANELRLLRNWRWIETRKRAQHYLGRRDESGRFLLKADLAAFYATGEERVVSRQVLDINMPDSPAPTLENTKRGAAREWSGTETRSGGASIQDLLDQGASPRPD
jgi:hypothetical protein